MSLTLNTDIAIIGGGIAGLWLNAQLRQQGFNTLLIEQNTLAADRL
jgi:glycerol-3-phosphate dehydrogenase